MGRIGCIKRLAACAAKGNFFNTKEGSFGNGKCGTDLIGRRGLPKLRMQMTKNESNYGLTPWLGMGIFKTKETKLTKETKNFPFCSEIDLVRKSAGWH